MCRQPYGPTQKGFNLYFKRSSPILARMPFALINCSVCAVGTSEVANQHNWDLIPVLVFKYIEAVISVKRAVI